MKNLMKQVSLFGVMTVLMLGLTGCAAPKQSETAGKTEEQVEFTAEKTAPRDENAASGAGTEIDLPDDPSPGSDSGRLSEQPFLTQITDDDPSTAYVLVRMQYTAGLLPLPLDGEYSRAIRQTLEDGSEMVNILHLTQNGFWMEESNCPGQDCINEGTVTLENREDRILWNLIVCLPHQLTAELLTREEAEQLFAH